ncbi:hypothetical protein NEDG_00897 [Nematocida displodere]|uniref:AAA+ ATPase domain-containing protein n=1 Tax=Nematocida displodere TaxID=1805483 RepID=A0A177ECT6_9MICR|nr:hypothetical protein NEDG_00897 [Nematocida displodere]
MRRKYTAEQVPYELEKDRSRAYFTPATLRELHIKPGAYVRVTKDSAYTILRAVPKFDGDDLAVYLPNEEIAYLGIRPGASVDIAKDEMCYPEAAAVQIRFKNVKKTAEKLESIKLVLEDKKAIRNNDKILGGILTVKEVAGCAPGGETPLLSSAEPLYKISHATKITIKTETVIGRTAVGVEKEAETLISLITSAHAGTVETPRGVCLTGGVGMGKKTLCRSVLEMVGCDWIFVRVKDTIAQPLEDAYEYAKLNEPCTLWIERIDRLFAEDKSSHASVAQIEGMFEDIHANHRRIAVLATSKAYADLPEELRARDVLDQEVALTPPTLQQRMQQISSAITAYQAKCQCTCPTVEDQAAKRTAGFSRGELGIFLREWAACPRSVPTPTPTPDRPSLPQATNGLETELRDMVIGSGAGPENPALPLCSGECMTRLLRGIVRVVPSASNERPAEVPDIRFSDIFGQLDAKDRLTEALIWPVQHRKLFADLGLSPPKGTLLYGPPGCGKTLMAQALANESGAVFLSVRGPEIMGKYVGESEERLRRVFARARAQAPSIIFIDEIDSIAPHRESNGGQVDKRVVSTLLTEMDGVGKGADVFVLGATNKPWSIDSALMRPGRFDHHILIDLPEASFRKEIISTRLERVWRVLEEWSSPTTPEMKEKLLSGLVSETEGFTGAELIGLLSGISLEVVRLALAPTPAPTLSPSHLCTTILAFATKTKPRLTPEEIGQFRRFRDRG